MTKPILELTALSRRFDTSDGQTIAVDAVDLTVHAGEFLSVVGPSGSGKTTLLRLIAGLDRPDAGRIVLRGVPVSDADTGLFVPPHLRGLGMVFQSGAIWPHMSVFDNVAFPLRAARTRPDKGEIARRVKAALTHVALETLAPRRASTLSGGQQQRVALARAIVAEPSLVLLDEPLSSLDAALRDQLGALLQHLQSELGLTFLQVTHDQSAALALSHRIAVMHAGHFVQIGTPEAVYDSPATDFVAGFIGEGGWLTQGDQKRFVRPEALEFHPEPQAGPGWLQVRVVGATYLGDRRRLRLETETGDTLIADQAPGAPVPATGYLKILTPK